VRTGNPPKQKADGFYLVEVISSNGIAGFRPWEYFIPTLNSITVLLKPASGKDEKRLKNRHS